MPCDYRLYGDFLMTFNDGILVAVFSNFRQYARQQNLLYREELIWPGNQRANLSRR